jgi:hypothetical protein
LLLAYALAMPLKRAELLPPHMTWLGIVVMPGALFAVLGGLFAPSLASGKDRMRHL